MEYKHLKTYTDKMQKIVDECVARVIKGQSDREYGISIPKLENEFNIFRIDEQLFLDMLSEREELNVLECEDGIVTVEVTDDFKTENKDGHLIPLSRLETQIKMAKHLLWLHDQYGGVQADFRNHIIKGVRFDGMDMCSVLMDGAKFVDCSFFGCPMSFIEADGTRFTNCELIKVDSEESDFRNAEFRFCNMQNGTYTHANFANAKFIQSNVSGVDMANACVANSEWIDTDKPTMDDCDWDLNEEDFDDGSGSPDLKM